jgi:hypothetical protein
MKYHDLLMRNMSLCISCVAFMVDAEMHQENSSIDIQPKPTHVFARAHCSFREQAHSYQQHRLATIERKCQMLICQLALVRLHIKRASLRVHSGIHCMRCSCILYMYIGHRKVTTIYTSSSANGFYTNL